MRSLKIIVITSYSIHYTKLYETGTHLERIREYARILTVQLAKNPKFSDRIDQQYIDDIYQSSILHDIGKVGTPDALLLKPGELVITSYSIHYTKLYERCTGRQS